MDYQSYSILNEKVDKQVLLIKRLNDSKQVVAKVLRQEFPEGIKLLQLENEFEITKSLSSSFVRKALSREIIQNRDALILEYFEGITLYDAFVAQKQSLETFLTFALKVTQVLGYIHQQRIIHKDINSSNILVNLATMDIRLIDFEISSKIDEKKRFTGNAESLEGTFAYMSPEQTGRMNRKLDYRSDLYSLGITFFELLTGTLPFVSGDALELVHMHIAQNPPPLTSINPKIPEILSQVILKLLSKNAEDRYQSALGVQKDLEICLRHFSAQGEIPDFPIAELDFSGELHIPQKLYGREGDIAVLTEAFHRISQGGTELVIVEGSPGVGKSALVHELHKLLTEKNGFFIEGKFEQFQRNIPFFAFTQAFSELVSMLLTESESKLAYWRDRINQAVGSLGKVITDLIPSLQLIIDKQPDIPELGVTESQNRLIYTFQNFIKAFCSESHPFVLFIDDLQWADSGSLLLLSHLMNDYENGYFLLIGAYRNNEVDSSHPLITTLDAIYNTNIHHSSVKLKNLSKENISSLLTDTLKSNSDSIARLSSLINIKTQGNPFFINQFLKTLYEDDLLSFDFATSVWKWNEKATNELNSTDNVIDLLVTRIQKLPVSVQEALKLAACIGTRFDLDILPVVLNKSAADVYTDLFPAVLEGLIMPSSYSFMISGMTDENLLHEVKDFQFVHDRIQQAVYSLIPSDQQQKVHFEIGKLLLNYLNAQQLDERIFEVVYHLNKGLEFIESDDEKIHYASLNAIAAARAKKSSAFKPALEFYSTAIFLAGKDKWQTRRQLLTELFTEGAEAAYLNGDFETMNNWLQEVFQHETDPIYLVKAYNVKIDAETSLNQLPQAVQTGIEILDKLGVHFPNKPTTFYIIISVLLTQLQLKRTGIEKLNDLPAMTDPGKLHAMLILQRLIPAAFMSGNPLFPLIVFKMVRLSLQYGNSVSSAMGYASFAITQTSILGNFEEGNRLGKASMDLTDRFYSEETKVKILFILNNFIFHWKEHIRGCAGPLLDSFQLGLKAGDLVGGTWSAYYRLLVKYFYGEELSVLQNEIIKYSNIFEQFKQEAALNRTNMLHQVVLNLLDKSGDLLSLTGEVFNEEKIAKIIQDGNDQTTVFCFHQDKAYLAYLFGEYIQAHEESKAAIPWIQAVTGLSELTTYTFYDALISLAALKSLPPPEQKKALAGIGKNRKKLSKWARSGQPNYLHKYLLVEAEFCRFKNDASRAGILYGKAAVAARKHEYIQEEAVIYERAGEFYSEQEDSSLAEYYLVKAYEAYRKWGALAKLKQLKEKYPLFVFAVDENDLNIHTSSTTKTSTFDLASVLKASTAISSEIVFDKFVEKLMKIAIENAGAQRGVLLLANDKGLRVEAEGIIDNQEIFIEKITGNESGSYLPDSVLQYVTRSRESLISPDISSDIRFSQDPVIIKNKTKSVLCFPIIHLGSFIGVIYLENNLVKGAFTSDRIEVLKLLSGQIAVSIQNSLIYDTLEEKVKERTAVIAHQKDEIDKERQKSEDLLLDILPAKTAEELKLKGFSQPRRYEEVTVMFADFVEFSKITETISPETLVKEIDFYYRNFDRIIAKHNIEKIKTIGDCYMCAGGLPEENNTHAYDMILAALEIHAFIEEEKQKRIINIQPYFENRIGIHTGPVVAGIVGLKKFAYDIWGDTVNVTARLEQNSHKGKINISTSTYELVKDKFTFNYRGKIQVKNKGEIDMYFLEQPLEEVIKKILI
jgi:histidine kinase